MTTTGDLVGRRLNNQRLTRSSLRTPEAIVSWLGAVQSQDYTGAKWALGMRAPGLTDAAIDRAFDDGAILRTHFLRPTWHFVTAADIRWMLTFTAPRVHASTAYYYRQHGLDIRTIARSQTVIERALRGGASLTRVELQAALHAAGILADGPRLGHFMMHAELDQLICSGPRRGKQFTYALLDERVPPTKTLTRDEAIAELTRRYFTSHGPATPRDFSWWSGLTIRDVKAGLEMMAPKLLHEEVDGLTYYFFRTPSSRSAVEPKPAYLFSNYDEFLIAYKDRRLVARSVPRVATAGDPFPHHLVVDGCLAGSWKRTLGTNVGDVTVSTYRALSATERRAVEAAAERYEAFLERPVRLLYH